MTATSVLEIQISLPFISQSWLIMDNHIALNFPLVSQGEIYIRANMSCYPYVNITEQAGECVTR